MYDRLSTYSPQALAVLRIVAAVLFIETGSGDPLLLRLPLPRLRRAWCLEPGWCARVAAGA
jgi:hypothetical protein